MLTGSGHVTSGVTLDVDGRILHLVDFESMHLLNSHFSPQNSQSSLLTLTSGLLNVFYPHFLAPARPLSPTRHLLTCRTELSVPGLTWCACEGASKSSRMKLFSFHETASGPSFTHWFVLSLPPSFLLKSTMSPA